MPTVFRWNITRREQLGRLVEGEPVDLHPAMLDELRLCCARVIAMAGDARLVFIGRSPEHLYDYLTGALAHTAWADRLTLVNLSLKSSGGAWMEPDAAAYCILRGQFAAHGLDPRSIAMNPRPVALVAAAISAQPAVRYPWCRVLAAELRAASRPKRVERVFASKQLVRSWRRHERIRSYARGR